MKLARMPDNSPEIFHTIQGEGRSIGLPTVFIRASLCNLHCRWCDTPYTWNWEGTEFEHDLGKKFNRADEIIDHTTDEIVEIVQAYSCSNYVFTGGEPLIQEKAWVELMRALRKENPEAHFEIETNGTLTPGDTFLTLVNQFNVSPKLSNSGIDSEKRIVPEALTFLAATGKADFKFVVGDADDLAELLKIKKEADISSNHIFLMPRAASVTELEANQAWVSALAIERGFRYSDRLHLRLFGAKRGV
ncbi:7-carboxy-7-deazaguanine synthase QueE [Verrucomicrobiales bacterium]|jgi:7-carboxy-7-deazaguanine synthase|nr:7-carboxy-7-deazaguanine synthase QueE [Verrucomicrobiales bacterium]|tara:strand:- start:110 stop:850 length:741 start_codon:yes stop_codon:yes gene_type:complete